MPSDLHARVPTSPLPLKVTGLGAPISVWIHFDLAEIPALKDAIGDALARYGHAGRIDGRALEPKRGVDPAQWRDHIGVLLSMLTDVEIATTVHGPGRFDVLWPTAIAHDVVHGAARHAHRRAAEASADDTAAARHAHMAADQTRRDFDIVDNGGLSAVWL